MSRFAVILTIKCFDLDNINSGIWISGCLWEDVESNKQFKTPGYFQKENRTKKTS